MQGSTRSQKHGAWWEMKCPVELSLMTCLTQDDVRKVGLGEQVKKPMKVLTKKVVFEIWLQRMDQGDKGRGGGGLTGFDVDWIEGGNSLLWPEQPDRQR